MNLIIYNGHFVYQIWNQQIQIGFSNLFQESHIKYSNIQLDICFTNLKLTN